MKDAKFLKSLDKLESGYRELADTVSEMKTILTLEPKNDEEEKVLTDKLESCMGKFLMKNIALGSELENMS